MNAVTAVISLAGFVVLTFLSGFLYRKKLLKGKRLQFLDFLVGLFFMCSVAAAYCSYDLVTGNNIFNDVFSLVSIRGSSFKTLLLYSLAIAGLYYIWRLLIRFVFTVGANYMLIITTTLLFALMTLHAIGNYIDVSTGLWGLLGFFVLSLVSLMCFFLIVVRFINFYRCPQCHAAGKRNVRLEDCSDLGYHTENSTEYKHDIDRDSSSWSNGFSETTTYTTKKYEVTKTMHDYEHNMRCRRCSHTWMITTSFTVNKNRDLASVKKDIETKIYH